MQIDFEGELHDFPDDFTDQDIAKALASIKPAAPQQAQPTPINVPYVGAQVGLAETAGTLLSGAAGMAAGGLEGAVKAPFIGMDAAAEAAKKRQEAMTYQPRTAAGQEYTQALGEGFGKVVEAGGNVGTALAPPQYEPLARTLGEAGTDVALNFLGPVELARAAKFIKKTPTSKAPIKALEALDNIAKTPENPVKAGAPMEPYTKQSDLPLDITNDVGTEGFKNPYDRAGYVRDQQAGLDTMLESPQGDLFAEGLRESANKRPDVVAAKDAFYNEATGLEARMRAALFIAENPKLFKRAEVKDAKTTIPELIKQHEDNRNAYHEGMTLLDQEKPRDAEGAPLYNPEEGAGGRVGEQPFDIYNKQGEVAPTPEPVTPVPTPKPRGPKRQAGAIYPGEIAEGIKKLLDGLGKPVEASHPAQEYITEAERTSKFLKTVESTKSNLFKAVGAEGVDLVPQAAPVTPELIAKIVSEPDVGSGKKLVSGYIAKAALNNESAGILYAGREIDGARKRAERADRDFVRPVAEEMKGFIGNAEKMEVFKGIMDREEAMSRRFTPDELKAAGIPEDVLNAYAGYRRMMDEAYKRQMDARAEAGQPKVPYQEWYQSARWNGPWRMMVTDAEGNAVWWVAEKSRRQAKAAEKWLKEKFPDLQFGDIKYNESLAKDPSNMRGGYMEMMALLGTDHPVTKQIKEILDAQAAFSTENVLGQEKHFKRKEGVRGHMGDRPWDETGDNRGWLLEQLQYAKNAFQWSESQSALRNIKELLNDPEVQQKKNLVRYLREYTATSQGHGTMRAFTELENGIAWALGLSPAAMDKTLGVTKSLFYITKLGFLNLPFTAAQLIQPVFTAPYHAVLSGQGFEHSMFRTTIEGASNGLNFYRIHFLKNYAKNEKAANAGLDRMDPLFRDASLYAEQNGVVDVSQFSDIKDLNTPAGLRTAEKVAGFNIKESEAVARSTAFMAFVSHLDQSGKFPATKEGRMALFQKAEEATRFTMVDYNPSERAMAFSKFGLAGNAASTLRTFSLNQVNQALTYMGKMKAGDVAPALTFFGLFYLLGGMRGFMGLEDADAMYNLLKQAIPDEVFAKLPKKLREFGVKKIVMEMPEMISMGPVSTAFNTNLYTRFDNSDILPFENTIGESLSSLFPFVKDTVGQVGGLKKLLMGDTNSERMAGGYAVTPTSLKGPFENLVPGFTNPQGVVGKTTKPEVGDYTRTPEERSQRNYGFRSAKEAKTKELNFYNDNLTKDYMTRRSNLSLDIQKLLLDGSASKLNSKIEAYIALGGDPKYLLASANITGAFVAKNTDRLQKLKLAAKSGNLTALQDLIRYTESLGVSTNP